MLALPENSATPGAHECQIRSESALTPKRLAKQPEPPSFCSTQRLSHRKDSKRRTRQCLVTKDVTTTPGPANSSRPDHTPTRRNQTAPPGSVSAKGTLAFSLPKIPARQRGTAAGGDVSGFFLLDRVSTSEMLEREAARGARHPRPSSHLAPSSVMVVHPGAGPHSDLVLAKSDCGTFLAPGRTRAPPCTTTGAGNKRGASGPLTGSQSPFVPRAAGEGEEMTCGAAGPPCAAARQALPPPSQSRRRCPTRTETPNLRPHRAKPHREM